MTRDEVLAVRAALCHAVHAGMRPELYALCDTALAAMERTEALERRLEALRREHPLDMLARYAMHSARCAIVTKDCSYPPIQHPECDCGLSEGSIMDAALTEEKSNG